MKKILVVGAGAYQVPLIKRCVELGYYVYAIDGNPSAVGFAYANESRVLNVVNKEACLVYAEEIGIDAVMTYGATVTLPTVAYVGRKMGLRVISDFAADLATNKYLIKKRIAECGLNVFGGFASFTDRKSALDFPFEYPCVLKPTDGSGSRGVVTVHAPDELEDAVDYAFSGARYGEIYCEGFIQGDEYTVEAFSDGERAYVYSVVKTTFNRKGGLVDYGHRTPSGLGEKEETLIKNEVHRVIEALKIDFGSVNMDVILSSEDGKPYVIDVGIRNGQNLIASHFVPLSRGVSVLDNAILLAVGEEISPEPKFQKCIATRLLIYKPGFIKEIKHYDEVIGSNGIVDVVLRKRVGDYLPEYKEKSDTCGWVITMGDTPDEAEKNAVKAKMLLEKYIIIE